MKGRSAAWALALLALGVPAAAQDRAEAGGESGPKKIRRDEVKSWTIDVDGKEWSARPAAPTFDGDTGLFRLGSAYTLPKSRFAVSLFRGNVDRDPKGTDFSVHGFNLAYGLSNRLELFGTVGLQNRAKANYLAEPGGPNDYPLINERWETGFGDIKVGLKYAFLNDYLGDGVGLALRGLVKLPTADETRGLGTGKVSFLGDLVLSKTIAYKADLHASIGYEINGDPDEVDIANAFRWGVGLNIPACTRFQIHAEVTGKSYGDSTFEQTNVADLIIGPSLWLGSGWFIRPSWSYAMGYDGRGRDVSFGKKSGRQIQIGYHPGTPCCEIETPPPPPPPPANRPPTVTLDCVRETVMPGESTPCNATAADPDGDRLTYAWSSTAGRVTGTTPSVPLDTTGVACDTVITVTVTVNDGRGGTASATDTVRVVCADRPKPQPATCSAGGFPRNMARLNNVDKACLDDVASKLRQDPRSRVLIVGHADRSERNPEVIGRQRAEAAKRYLVTERGIDEARISTRSSGAAKPLDTGTAADARGRNRRIEVIFVPDGAAVPETN
jgi:hypothetical protein